MRLELQRCLTCGGSQLLARPLCTACGGTRLTTAHAAGTGSVYSYTVVRRPPRPGVVVPYTVAVVRLTEGPSMLTHVVDCPEGALRCGLEVTLTWRTGPDGEPLAVFTPVTTTAGTLPAPVR